jgi:oligosaccharyl transferase STT3 subunit
MRPEGDTIRHGAGRLLALSGAIAGAWAAVTLISGGFVLRAGRLGLSSRDPFRPLLGAAGLLAVALILLPRAEWRGLLGRRDRVAGRIACAAAACTLVFSIAWTSRSAGGSDSSCYVLQAEAFVHGRATLVNPAASVLPEAAPAIFAPTGFVPSRARPAEAVPICGPGLALVMAGALLVHRDAVFLVVPAFAALLVWLTFVFGRRVDDEVTGACAAVLMACSPVFLYQAVQPMSDVPAAALWLAALTAGPIAGGLCASLAVLMRPNFALVVLPLVFLLRDRRSLVRFALAGVPAAAIMIGLNVARYGAPFASGYGDTGALFALAHVGPNAARYSRWLLETHTPFLLLALAAPWTIGERRGSRRLALVSLAACALIAATYLAYTVFDDWWYTRFLLPAIPILLVLSVAFALHMAEWLPPSGGRSSGGLFRAAVAAGLGLVLCPWYLHVARARHVLDLQGLESRFAIAGRYAGRALPPKALVLAVQQSGSVRFHGGRDTIAWDQIPPDALDRTIARIQSAGRAPFIVLEDAEEPAFRRRFPSQRFGRLEWPPQVEIHAPVRVHFYDPAALDRYLAGQRIDTEHVR